MDKTQIDRAADIFNALLRYEIGDSAYETLRRADPALHTPHDHCDANMLVLSAVSHVMECDESRAFDIVTNGEDGAHLGDVIQESAEDKRDLFSLSRYA